MKTRIVPVLAILASLVLAAGPAFAAPNRTPANTRVVCYLTTTATTSTAITGCAAPGAGLSIYITDISVYGGVANAITAASSVQYGTGGTCGTGTTVVYSCQHP